MTFFAAFTILVYLALIALLWCFRGFSRELKSGRKTVGLIVKVVPQDESAVRIQGGMRRVLEKELRVVPFPQRKAPSFKLARMIGLAQALESRRWSREAFQQRRSL